jgi:hypothetical protein
MAGSAIAAGAAKMNLPSRVLPMSMLLFTGLAAAQPVAWTPPGEWIINTIVAVVVLGSLISILVVRSALFKSTNWSLAEALSEEIEVSAQQIDSGGKASFVMQDGKPVTVTVMRPSSSRVIALMGLVVILLMFVGFGAFALSAFARTGEMPASMDKVRDFLFGGMTMFAPYVVNKFASVFSAFAPKKT